MNAQNNPRGPIGRTSIPEFFEAPSGRTLVLRGRRLDVSSLYDRIHAGHRRRRDGHDDGLHALQAGLEAICNTLGRQQVTYEDLHSIWKGARFNQASHCYAQRQAVSHPPEARDGVGAALWSNMLEIPTCNIDAMRLVLRLLEPRIRVRLALGTCVLESTSPTGVACYYSKVHERILPNAGDPGLETCQIIWIAATGNMSMPSGYMAPTWSGIALPIPQAQPRTVITIEDDDDEVEPNDDQENAGPASETHATGSSQNRSDSNSTDSAGTIANTGTTINSSTIGATGNTRSPASASTTSSIVNGQSFNPVPQRDRYPTHLTEDEVIERYPHTLFEEPLLYILRKYSQKDLLQKLATQGDAIKGDALRQRKHAALEKRCQRLCDKQRIFRSAEIAKKCVKDYNQEVTAYGAHIPRQPRNNGASISAKERRQNAIAAAADAMHVPRPLQDTSTATGYGRRSVDSYTSYGSLSVSPISISSDVDDYIYRQDVGSKQLPSLVNVLAGMEPAEETPSWLIQPVEEATSWPIEATLQQYGKASIAPSNVHVADQPALVPQFDQRIGSFQDTPADSALSPGHNQFPQPDTLFSTGQLRSFYRQCHAPRKAGATLGVGPPGIPTIPFIWRKYYNPPTLTLEQIKWYDQYWNELPIYQRWKLSDMRNEILSLRYGQLHHVRDEVARSQDKRGTGTERWTRELDSCEREPQRLRLR